MSIKADLSRFYTKNAHHYHQTRQKFWADGERIVKVIRDLSLEKPRILELGCGGGRFLSYLKEHYDGDFEYVGIDMSEGLLELARKDNPEAEFILGDMSQVLKTFGAESFDIIVACASFQHLPIQKERQEVMNSCYRLLRYDGVLMMTNWALSQWFLRKHWKVLLKSVFLSFFSLGRKCWRDVFIPWKSGNTVEMRYYHLFGLGELKQLLLLGGFTIGALGFLDKRGEWTSTRKTANNSFFIAKKAVFMHQ